MATITWKKLVLIPFLLTTTFINCLNEQINNIKKEVYYKK